MFGTVLARFQIYMTQKLGQKGWESLLQEADLPLDKVYRTARFYQDNEFDRLFELASQKTELLKEDLYKELGKDFGHYLLSTYHRMFFSSWKTLEVIEKAAPIVFKTIQLVDPATSVKSEVKCSRISPKEVVIYYTSPRRMCTYILGIINAIADHFNEKIEVKQPVCAHKGGIACEIHVKLLNGS